MAGKFTIRGQVEGVAEFARALQDLKRGVRNRVLRRMINAGIRPVKAAVKAKAQELGYGAIAGAVATKSKTYSRSGAVVGIVGAAKGKEKSVPTWSWYLDRAGTVKRYVPRKTIAANILHLVELGTRPHAIGKGSRLTIGGKRDRRAGPQHGPMHPGAKPHPILRPAWDESKGAARSAMMGAGAEGLKAELAKVSKP